MTAGNCVIVNDTPANLEVVGEAGIPYAGYRGLTASLTFSHMRSVTRRKLRHIGGSQSREPERATPGRRLSTSMRNSLSGLREPAVLTGAPLPVWMSGRRRIS
jgi:hypothetical protein